MSANQYASLVLRTPSKRVFAPRFGSAGRLETLVVAAGICLPVPLLAATGLSVPLPNVVERIAAALVPWAEPVAFESSELQGASGTIVPAAGETTLAAVTPPAHGSLPATASPTAPSAKPATSSSQADLSAEAAPAARPTATGGHAVVPTAGGPAAVPATPQPEV